MFGWIIPEPCPHRADAHGPPVGKVELDRALLPPPTLRLAALGAAAAEGAPLAALQTRRGGNASIDRGGKAPS